MVPCVWLQSQKAYFIRKASQSQLSGQFESLHRSPTMLFWSSAVCTLCYSLIVVRYKLVASFNLKTPSCCSLHNRVDHNLRLSLFINHNLQVHKLILFHVFNIHIFLMLMYSVLWQVIKLYSTSFKREKGPISHSLTSAVFLFLICIC